MLADPDIDVVHLATPNYLHHPHAKAALLAGKHVVCEKPLAMNTAESAELVKLAAEKKLVNAVNFNIRMYPLAQQARSMVQSGELGDLFILQGSYLQDWLLFPTDWNWRLEPDLGGTLRAVGDIGSHWLDLLTFITGLHVEEVYADFKTFHPIRKKPAKPLETFTGKILTPEDYIDQPIHTEDYATILLHYENGVRGVLTVSQVSSGRKNRLFYEINGSKSSLVMGFGTPQRIMGRSSDRTQPGLDERPVAALAGSAGNCILSRWSQRRLPRYIQTALHKSLQLYFGWRLFSKTPDFPTFADGHYEMQLCEAIERSAKEGKWVKV